jgi:ABC-type branched-subunit amino acid transport system ATPase component
VTPLLKAEGLSKSYRGVQALQGVDLEIHEGEILGLVGPNGSGKTTFFNCVTGFARASQGRIYWDGDETTTLAPDQMARRGVVRTFQQKMVYPRSTVRENIEMSWSGRQGAQRREFHAATDLLSFLGLSSLQDALAEDIPFGSARKLGIGLALAASPRLLLLDEPAAGLNQDESEELGHLIARIADLGITICVIEHDVPLVMSTCQRVVVLHAGKKIAEGQPSDVAVDERVVAVFLGERFARSTRTQ